jgi:hypothetical protein
MLRNLLFATAKRAISLEVIRKIENAIVDKKRDHCKKRKLSDSRYCFYKMASKNFIILVHIYFVAENLVLWARIFIWNSEPQNIEQEISNDEVLNRCAQSFSKK